MEGVAAAAADQHRPSLGQPSPSFRLRTESLNMLRLRRVFDLLDQNCDDEITVEEIALALDSLGLGTDPAELQSMVADFITPGRFGLAFDDFEALYRALGDALFGRPTTTEEEDMRVAFQVFDEDGNGFISTAELQAVLSKLGLPEGWNIAKVHEMICFVDRNLDDGGRKRNEGCPREANQIAAVGCQSVHVSNG